jgi:hypothetical protein
VVGCGACRYIKRYTDYLEGVQKEQEALEAKCVQGGWEDEDSDDGVDEEYTELLDQAPAHMHEHEAGAGLFAAALGLLNGTLEQLQGLEGQDWFQAQQQEHVQTEILATRDRYMSSHDISTTTTMRVNAAGLIN